MILKLKRTPGLYLVGFMGSGKTTVGGLVAEELGWTFADLDEEIEAEQGTSIARIFSERGESEFRRLESEKLHHRVRQVQRGRPMVLALGGGAFIHTGNFELLAENGVTIWLECPFAVVRERIGSDPNRPLSRNLQAMEELYELRRDAYMRADFRIDATPDPVAVCKAILKLPIF
jgi:shikimate kinase